jgi:hypothetical protein
MQQILVLVDESNFTSNCTFQVLCSVGASTVYLFFQVSAQKEFWYRESVRWTCWPWDSPKHEITLWKRLRSTSMLQCGYLARFFSNVPFLCPGRVKVAELSDVHYAEMLSLLCEHFSRHQGCGVGVGVGRNFRWSRSRYIFTDSDSDLNLKS